MAGNSHATRHLHTGVSAVLLVAFLVVLTAAILVVRSHHSGDSPSTPTPGAHLTAVERTFETCTWRRNGWYC
jgi:hypothetical protein